MGQHLLKFVGALGGAAVVFYAIGFTVVQTYVHRHQLGSVFLFTDEFYRDAGAVFLLDMIRAPILGFYIFIPLFVHPVLVVAHCRIVQGTLRPIPTQSTCGDA